MSFQRGSGEGLMSWSLNSFVSSFTAKHDDGFIEKGSRGARETGLATKKAGLSWVSGQGPGAVSSGMGTVQG